VHGYSYPPLTGVPLFYARLTHWLPARPFCAREARELNMAMGPLACDVACRALK
jgi:hypothetical protein